MEENQVGLLKERFVAVIMPFGKTGYANDDALWAELRKDGVQGLLGQAQLDGSTDRRWYFFTAALKPLRTEKGRGSRGILEAFEKLAEEERKPASLNPDPGTFDVKSSRYPQRPEGILALRNFCRMLTRAADGSYRPARWHHLHEAGAAQKRGLRPGELKEWEPVDERWRIAEPAQDIVWIPEPEWSGLIPADPREKSSFAMPEPLRVRLLRFGLHNQFAKETGYWWKPEDIRSASITLKVDAVTQESITLSLEGSVLLHQDLVTRHFKKEYDGLRIETRYEARLSGILKVDRRRRAFTRFDVVAIGDYQGIWVANGYPSNLAARPLGFAFELASGEWGWDESPPYMAWSNPKEYGLK